MKEQPLRTTVIGSYPFPGWLELSCQHLDEFGADADPGDFIFVPPYAPYQEINASADAPLECVVIRSGQEPIIVNLDVATIEPPEEVRWVDPIHPSG
jgi:uncharacterized RmlC-like cupin family protein